MTALASERSTKRYGQEGLPALYSIPVKGGVKIYKGSLVVVDAGYAAPGRTATGLLCAGCAQETVDNTAGSSGDKFVEVMSGAHKWVNSTSGDQITQADLFTDVYIVDDQTVAKTSNTGARSKAGKVVRIGADGAPYVLAGPAVL